ncbi:MAG: tRNA (N6-threonylcarbamoyladenosine(37)-N6)-methyltransferase TrmO [Bacteroidia bacterium]|nr:tRNA (N6-threonylcarbamoyladenosine(37)-N6)-methyltransferase TrmO [Bacteroidia bacterium]
MTIEPIAYFKSPFSSKFGIPRQSGVVNELRGEIHFTEKYRRAEALKGIEGFDWLWLIWEFSANPKTESDNWKATVRPPRLGGNANMGVFATRSPFRPNPLGLSCVRLEFVDLEAKDAPVIHVLGADMMDGTPIYDIKPYITYADSHPDARSGFVDATVWSPLEVLIPDSIRNELEKRLGAEETGTLVEVLKQDPRPHYQSLPSKVYGMPFHGHDIHFVVEDNVLTVKGFSG